MTPVGQVRAHWKARDLILWGSFFSTVAHWLFIAWQQLRGGLPDSETQVKELWNGISSPELGRVQLGSSRFKRGAMAAVCVHLFTRRLNHSVQKSEHALEVSGLVCGARAENTPSAHHMNGFKMNALTETLFKCDSYSELHVYSYFKPSLQPGFHSLTNCTEQTVQNTFSSYIRQTGAVNLSKEMLSGGCTDSVTFIQ